MAKKRKSESEEALMPGNVLSWDQLTDKVKTHKKQCYEKDSFDQLLAQSSAEKPERAMEVSVEEVFCFACVHRSFALLSFDGQ